MKKRWTSFVRVGVLGSMALTGCNDQPSAKSTALAWGNSAPQGLAPRTTSPAATNAPSTGTTGPAAAPSSGPITDAEGHPVYTTLDQVMGAEARCMDLATNTAKYDCLEPISDWWFHEGGNVVAGNPFVQMIRVMQVQVALDPSDVDKASTIAYYQWSNDISDMVDRVASDFSMRPLQTLLLAEEAQAPGKPANKNTFGFYYLAQDVPLSLITHPEYGSDATKQKYYAELKRFHTRGLALWATQDRSQMTADSIAKVDRYNRTIERVLTRLSRFDVPAGVQPLPAPAPLPSTPPLALPSPTTSATAVL